MDNINNNYNNYKNSFYGTLKKEKPVNGKEEKMKNLINKSTDALADFAQRQVPENNKFNKVFVAFNVPDTKYEAFISVMHDEINPKTQRRLAVELHHKNSDRFYTEYMHKGTKNEILDFVADKKNQQEIFDIVAELSKQADEYYNK